MDANIFSPIASGLGMAGGLWALVRWSQERKTNGNGHGSPSEPPPTIPSAEILRVMGEHHKRMEDIAIKAANPIVIREPQLPQPDPSWVADLEARSQNFLTQVVERDMRMVRGLGTLIDRVEALVQMGPPVITVEVGVPKELTELPEQVSKKQDESGRKLIAAAKSSPPPPARPPRSAGQPRAIPNPLPPLPSIPPGYVGGAVTLTGGQVSNLLLLIQQQLQPNCPGTCVQLRLEAESEVFVGAASFLGGALTSANYAYALEPGQPRIYQSAYPGSSCPLGDLQVLGSGALHVEVQL